MSIYLLSFRSYDKFYIASNTPKKFCIVSQYIKNSGFHIYAFILMKCEIPSSITKMLELKQYHINKIS